MKKRQDTNVSGEEFQRRRKRIRRLHENLRERKEKSKDPHGGNG